MRAAPWGQLAPPALAVTLSLLVTMNLFPGVVTAIGSTGGVPNDRFKARADMLRVTRGVLLGALECVS